ncbi:hypothetical protein IV203_007564 [Nitzschia inconspicua]|uniref:Uncharacterized protein n=1 Tax=Nitzschia inconspicua TaxID=303405 RepID=A0A9K3KFR8_9STRA|nr:hypothetical protein IV203_007564 [Nitzschia inconspicua]
MSHDSATISKGSSNRNNIVVTTKLDAFLENDEISTGLEARLSEKHFFNDDKDLVDAITFVGWFRTNPRWKVYPQNRSNGEIETRWNMTPVELMKAKHHWLILNFQGEAVEE